MKKIAMAGVFLLGACSSAPPLFTSDGRATTQVSCSSGNNWAECDRRAQVICGAGGYDLLSHSETDNQRTAYIACRKPAQSY
jgi:hypothetical protein